MKIYIATRNSIHQGTTLHVGETYTFSTGLDYYVDPMSTFVKCNIYGKDYVLMEIEIIEKQDNKSVVNKFKVLRIVTPEEYPELIGYTLDSKGNIIKKEYPDGTSHIYEYDSNGNKIKETYLPDGETYFYEYDSNGNKIKQIQPNGNTWTYEYDLDGRIIKQIKSDGEIWTYEYDLNNKTRKQVGPDGKTWIYEYLLSEQLIRIVNPDGEIWKYGDK